jgi:hypothetical protein
VVDKLAEVVVLADMVLEQSKYMMVDIEQMMMPKYRQKLQLR